MKKVLFLMLVMLLGAFASPLFAYDIGCDIEKSQTLSDFDGATSMPSDITISKVNIWHRDTLAYSSFADTKLNKKIMKTSGSVQNINANLKRIAVVCYPRGGIEA